MAEMTYFQFFADHARYLEPFGDEERGRLLSALTAYAFEGREIELTGNERYIWPVFRRMVDQSRASLEKKQAAGAARARAAASESQRAPARPSIRQRAAAEPPGRGEQEQDHEQEQEQEQEKEHEQEQEQEQRPRGPRETRETREKIPPLPPTPDEVKAFAKENALKIDAERFCNYYAARGWQSRGDPIRDWRPIVRNWAATEGKPMPAQPPRVLREQQYAQREYADSTDALDAMMADWMKRNPEQGAAQGGQPGGQGDQNTSALDAMMADWMKRNPEQGAAQGGQSAAQGDPFAGSLFPSTPNDPEQGGTT